ncbi:spore germination protein [Paenibacillus sp. LPE1-1-1.1]|uniref:spore germination protein n=1 Tax=Paenibacillus sp. LPE1-1-1.1 TaxID=3135230 RepID=UPI003412FB1D
MASNDRPGEYKQSENTPVTDKPASGILQPISQSLSNTREELNKLLSHCHDIVMQPSRYGDAFQYQALSVHCNSLVEEKEVLFLKSVFLDLASQETGAFHSISPEDVIRFFENRGVTSNRVSVVEKLPDAVQQMMCGHVVIFFDGWNKALSFNAFSVESRTVSEPITEPVVRGPHDSTTEDLTKNIGLLRTRLRNHLFKIELFSAGGKCRTTAAFGYLEGAVNPETLEEFKKRLGAIKEVEILDTSFIEEMIEDSTYSPFPQHRYTERPDTAIAAVLDGKIIVLVSGSPSIMICPGLFAEFFATSEDYYYRTVEATLLRQLRVIAFFMALMLPSIYIAMSTFHSELIPTVLLMAVLETREGIPFPALVEALLMEFFFELLREAGIRLPRPVGTAVSIVGALVIGQAAIQAKIASPIMIIIVALTGIASFSMPQYSLGVALRVLRFPLMILSGTLGGFGLMMGLLFIHLHLTALRSLGQPYLATFAPLRIRQLRDVWIRAPLKTLLRSPRNKHMHKRQ